MRKQKTEVIEDMVITETCPGGRKIYTGCKSVLQLPFTISFMCKGDYNVSIRDGEIVVTKCK